MNEATLISQKDKQDLRDEAKETTLNGIKVKLSPVEEYGKIKWELFIPDVTMDTEVDPNAPSDKVIALPDNFDQQEKILNSLIDLADQSQSPNELWHKINDLRNSL